MLLKFAQDLKKKYRHEQSVQTDRQRWKMLQTWYASELGSRLLQSEEQALATSLPDLFGYYLLQCGCPEAQTETAAGHWLKESRVSSRFCLDFFKKQEVSVQSEHYALPVQSDSLDVVLLPHVLEFSQYPHEVLREVERVLIAEGHVVILGFNPWSIWNLMRLLPFTKKLAPWNGDFLSASRVTDWLSLLGFDLIEHQGYFYRPPIQNTEIALKMSFLERLGKKLWPKFGAGYMLIARKRVETLTPIKPRWESKRQILANGLEASNRNITKINRNKCD